MKNILLLNLIFWGFMNANAQDGLTITNKGIVLQNLPNQNTVSYPAIGTVIYNTATKSPNFYDGKNWNSLNATALSSGGRTDSTTYRVVSTNNASLNFSNAELPIFSLSSLESGYPNGAKFGLQDFHFIKNFDENSLSFQKAIMSGGEGQSVVTIVFSVYKQKASLPFSQITLTNFNFGTISIGVATGGIMTEEINMATTQSPTSSGPSTAPKIKFSNVAIRSFVEYNIYTGIMTSGGY